MRNAQTRIEVKTKGRSLTNITPMLQTALQDLKANQGLLHLFLQHTSASLLIQENADPDVLSDLERFFSRLVPDGDPLFQHVAEGPDDMPSHVRTALTQVQISLPVGEGGLMLGTWQGVYLYEHRHAPHTRGIVLSYTGS